MRKNMLTWAKANIHKQPMVDQWPAGREWLSSGPVKQEVCGMELYLPEAIVVVDTDNSRFLSSICL